MLSDFSLFLGDTASCLLPRTVCFSCLLAKTSDTSVDGRAVHQTAERHISAGLPGGATEGWLSADPRWSVSGSRRQALLPAFKSKTDEKEFIYSTFHSGLNYGS